MSEELQVSEWDNFTPEQKHLLQVWIQSLQEAQVASIELIKSFKDKETTSEAITTLNAVSFPRTLPLPESPPEVACDVLLVICKAKCRFNSNSQQCLDDCMKNSNCR
ncbi:hypothetical protein [Nostoc sp. 'Lobaria pulmonaria (5183) cyanobiont']|uniref:hypothetical protein n=1 Tax=Nostoc sp. 'Lobaria pulmonaria (5183) cyanobiont' TaxID=1618022 RepID=UPI000CF35131|nr:hypothetical protein [Nostoc sp. 'Lobaria pulmonaria (5183) cyanobiont']